MKRNNWKINDDTGDSKDIPPLREMWMECPYADYMELRKLFLAENYTEAEGRSWGDMEVELRERLTHSSIQPDMVVDMYFHDWEYEPEDGSPVELHVLLWHRAIVYKEKQFGDSF